MKLIIIIFAFFLLPSCQIYQNKSNTNRADLYSKIDTIIKSNQFNGVILLTQASDHLYSQSSGYADIEKKIPIKLSDQFVIGSISKQISAVLILVEYENKNIELKDTIHQYLPEIKQPWAKEVTIHQLLTHTHGIVDLQKPIEFKKESKFQYSQLGYELLARIIEKVTGKSYQEVITNFFNKHGLTGSFHPNNKNYKHLVKGYIKNQQGILEFAENSLYNYPAAGSLISNAKDLNRWNQLLHTGQLINKESLKLMKTRYATRNHPIFNTVEYGYGLLYKNDEQNIQIGALGYAPGFVSASYYYPKNNMSLIVLENIAKDLNDFKKTFKVHTEIMKLIKNQHP